MAVTVVGVGQVAMLQLGVGVVVVVGVGEVAMLQLGVGGVVVGWRARLQHDQGLTRG